MLSAPVNLPVDAIFRCIALLLRLGGSSRGGCCTSDIGENTTTCQASDKAEFSDDGPGGMLALNGRR